MFCPNCGKDLGNVGKKFCPECGAEMTVPQVQETARSEVNPVITTTKKKSILPIAIVCILVAAIVAGITMLKPDNKLKQEVERLTIGYWCASVGDDYIQLTFYDDGLLTLRIDEGGYSETVELTYEIRESGRLRVMYSELGTIVIEIPYILESDYLTFNLTIEGQTESIMLSNGP